MGSESSIEYRASRGSRQLPVASCESSALKSYGFDVPFNGLNPTVLMCPSDGYHKKGQHQRLVLGRMRRASCRLSSPHTHYSNDQVRYYARTGNNIKIWLFECGVSEYFKLLSSLRGQRLRNDRRQRRGFIASGALGRTTCRGREGQYPKIGSTDRV